LSRHGPEVAAGAQQFTHDAGPPPGGIQSTEQGSFDILGRNEIGDERSEALMRMRVITTVNYRLR
jgi:hypothetical protein